MLARGLFSVTHTALQSVDKRQPDRSRGRALDVVAVWTVGQLEDSLCVALSQIVHPQHGVHYSQSRGLSFELERR